MMIIHVHKITFKTLKKWLDLKPLENPCEYKNSVPSSPVVMVDESIIQLTLGTDC
jgi:hypothetical protein